MNTIGDDMSQIEDSAYEFDSPGAEERYARLLDFDLPDEAIKRYVASEEFQIPGIGSDTKKRVAEKLNDEELEKLISQYKYAGRQSVNYFIITGISDRDADSIVQDCESEIVTDSSDVGTRELYLASTEKIDDRLYLSFGYFESTTDTDPETGVDSAKEIRDRVVVVVRDNEDLVEIRCSDKYMAKKTGNRISSSLDIERDSTSYRPEFGYEFDEKFREELVEKYYSLKLKIEDREGRTVETVRYNAKTNEEGERLDARNDEDVSKQLDEDGGEIRMGYVELDNGLSFHINRDQSKISFRKFERESNYNEITEVINDVLRQTGEYTQSKLEGLRNVPE